MKTLSLLLELLAEHTLSNIFIVTYFIHAHFYNHRFDIVEQFYIAGFYGIMFLVEMVIKRLKELSNT